MKAYQKVFLVGLLVFISTEFLHPFGTVVTPGDTLTRTVTFRFALDAKGLKAVSDMLTHEIISAQKNNKDAEARFLLELKKSWTMDNYRQAPQMVRKVSVTGPFNGWRAGDDLMKKAYSGRIVFYSITKQWEFSDLQEPYKIVFELAAITPAVSPAFLQNKWIMEPYGNGRTLVRPLTAQDVHDSVANKTMNIWVPDPWALLKKEDGFGGQNSILILKTNQ